MAHATSWGHVVIAGTGFDDIRPLMPEFLRAPLVAVLLPAAVILWVIVLGAIILARFTRLRLPMRFLAVGAIAAIGCSVLLGVVATAPSEVTP